MLAHVAVFVLAVGAGRYAKQRRRAPRTSPIAPMEAAAFVRALVEIPQQVVLVASRLQVDRFERGRKDDPRRSLNGAFDVRAAAAASRTFARLWRRRRSRAPSGDGRASEARAAADEYVVALLGAADLDAGTATAALGYAAWAGLPRACRALVDAGARLDYAPADGLRRSVLHVAAARGFARIYADLKRRAKASGSAPGRVRDAFGYRAGDLGAALPRGGIAEIDAADFRREDLERSIYGGAPLLVRGLASNWSTAAAWSLDALATRDDLLVRPHPIPHGESFGIPAPSPETTLGAFVRGFLAEGGGAGAPPDYVFDAGPTAEALLAEGGGVRARVQALLAPSAELDGALDGVPGRLDAAGHGRSYQAYVGPAGAGAPFHYHEHALNVLLVGAKKWSLLPPDRALYSTRHPTAATPPAGALAAEQRAGDALFVPANWAHAVVNRAPSAGVAVEFVDAAMVHWMNTRLFAPHRTPEAPP